jgi:phospholipase/carboxylesterase
MKIDAASLGLKVSYFNIKQLSRRQFLLVGGTTLGTMLLLNACKREFSSAQAPTKSTFGDKSLSLNFISVPPANGQAPVGLIVCLHGFTGNSQQLAPFAPMFNLPEYQFLFPDAPYSNPYGGRMWYNLRNQDYQGLAASRQQLTDWLKSLESTTGVPLSRTILAGFSQGGAMTLDVGLTLPLAGLVCLSGYLHSMSEPPARKSFPPVLIVHGKQDQMVPVSSAQRARDSLKALGVTVKYQEFDMGHIVIPEVLVLMRSFVIETIQANEVRR